MENDQYTTKYGWKTLVNTVVQNANGGLGLITMTHQPEVGDVVDLQTVGSYDNELSEIKAIRNQNQGAGNGIVVSRGSSTFTVDYNSEVYGVELEFRVTVLEIVKAI